MHAQAFTELLGLVVWLARQVLIFLPPEHLLPLSRAPILGARLRAELADSYIKGPLPRLVLILPLSTLNWAAGHLQPPTFQAFCHSTGRRRFGYSSRHSPHTRPSQPREVQNSRP